MSLNFYLKVREYGKGIACNVFCILVIYFYFFHDLQDTMQTCFCVKRYNPDLKMTPCIVVVTCIGTHRTIAGERLDTHRCFFPIAMPPGDHRRDRQFKFEPTTGG